MSDIIQTYLSPEGLRRFIEEAKANVPEEKAKEYERGTTLGYAKNTLYGEIEKSGGRIVIKNKDGEEGYINKSSASKIVNATRKSVKNGFTEEQHYAAAADIVNLYRNSIKILNHPDEKRRRNVESINRFVAPLYGDNVVYITGKEIIDGGKKIHSLELSGIGKLEGTVGVKSNLSPTPATNNPAHNIQNPPTLG